MSGIVPFICQRCRAQLQKLPSTIRHASLWQQSRNVSRQIERRRPAARMVLSPKVARRDDSPGERRRVPRSQILSPFGGLNQQHAGVPKVARSRSAAELKRATSGKEVPQKERETFHALKMQRSLAAIPYGHRATIKERLQDYQSFDDFELLPIVREAIYSQALSGLTDLAPTAVQRLAIPTLLGQEKQKARRSATPQVDDIKYEQYLIAAETGSGKTLAYLLPLTHAIKEAEKSDIDIQAYDEALQQRSNSNRKPHELALPEADAPHPTTGRPRAIILVPTSELVSQVGRVAKSLSHSIKFRTALLSSSYSAQVIRNRLFSPGGIDLVITTPHLLSSIAESDPNILSRVTHLVIDEADSLLDRSFSPSTSAVLDKTAPSLRQLILCSATIPRSLDSFLNRRFPNIRRLVTPNLHAIPRRVQLGVVDVQREPYQGNKDLACADQIWQIGKAAAEQNRRDDTSPSSTPTGEDISNDSDVKRILVFVNEREKTNELAEYLTSKGIQAVALNRDTPEQRQNDILGTFTSSGRETVSLSSSSPNTLSIPPSGPNFTSAASRPSSSSPSPFSSSRRSSSPPHPSSSPPKRHLPNTRVLVSTDLGSRGIDTLAVRHVILYDVPHSTIDFIHRLGRTGRMGRRGKGLVLVGKGDRGDVVREIREGMFKGMALI